MEFDINSLLARTVEVGASDVHVASGFKPQLRLHMLLEPAEEFPVLTPEQTEQFIRQTAGEEGLRRLLHERDMEYSTAIPNGRRFRVNAHLQRNAIAITFHVIPDRVPALSELGLPAAVDALANARRGLILVTGQTGNGKSTTLAAMISEITRKSACHIITIEDPIEYELHSETGLIEQREVGRDVGSFADGLRSALRQDPDVIMVGEMRDLETTAAAVTAAETGHLVLSSLHTQSAHHAVERIIDVYPANQQELIRSMLANSLRAVINQALFKRADGQGVVPACGVMICTPAVRNCIRENRIHEIPNIIQTGREEGMRSFEDSIVQLYLDGLIDRRQAEWHVSRSERLKRLLSA